MSVPIEDLDDETRARLYAVSVDIGYGRSRSMYDLVLGWTAHVGRLKAEQGQLLSENANLWNEHDYIAALGIRDFVERGLAMLDSHLGGIARELVSRADVEYISFTQEQEGSRELLSRVADVEPADREWWWNRIPKEGFILDNMNRHYR